MKRMLIIGLIFTVSSYGSVTDRQQIVRQWVDFDGFNWSIHAGEYSNMGPHDDTDVSISTQRYNDLLDGSEPQTAQEVCLSMNLKNVGEWSLAYESDFERLLSYFEHNEYGYLSEKGMLDLYVFLPELNGKMFWASTLRAPSWHQWGGRYQVSEAVIWMDVDLMGGSPYISSTRRTNLAGVACIKRK